MRLYIREWRKARGLTQTEAGERVGMKQPNWSQVERAVYGPSVRQLVKLARALRIKPQDLFALPQDYPTKRSGRRR